MCPNLLEPRWPVFICACCDPPPPPSCPRATRIKLVRWPQRESLRQAVGQSGIHYSIPLTRSTAMVTSLMNKSRRRGTDNSDTAPLLLSVNVCIAIHLSLPLLLFFNFFLSSTLSLLASRPPRVLHLSLKLAARQRST